MKVIQNHYKLVSMVLLAIFLSVTAAILAQYCNKKLVDSEPLEKMLSIMFFGCLLLGWTTVLFFRPFTFNLFVAIVGFVNFLAVWSFTRGIKISLAQTILILPLTSVVAVAFSAGFLGEWHFFDPRALGGIFMLGGSLGVLIAAGFFATSRRQELAIRRQWVGMAVVYILITGLVNFLIKFFAVQQVTPSNYLVSWYSGAFLGSLLPFLIKDRWSMKIVRDKLFFYLFFILGTFGAMAASFWALILAPAALVLPLYSFLSVAGTVLIAFFVFHEGENFGLRERTGLAIGIISGALLLIGGYW